MRFVILGAGGVGCVIGGRLFERGEDVTLIARGAHFEALDARGLELRDPDRTVTLPIPTVPDPAEAELGAGDVVVLATKTQQSEAALDALAPVAPANAPLICAQNGVENERLALRRFANTYGMCVVVPATHMEPGIVELAVAPCSGLLDIGRYPLGVDDVTERVAAVLTQAGFDARPDPRVMDRKYLKLLSNLGNSIEAACGTRWDDPDALALFKAARAEARACFEAAGIEVADEAADRERRAVLGAPRAVGGRSRTGGSSWQSLARATGNIETDWLNGEIVLLGRLHGVLTPVNERLQRVANRMARDGLAPGSIPAAQLLSDGE